MNVCLPQRIAILAVILAAPTVALGDVPADPLAGPAAWKPSEWSELRTQVFAWLQSTDAGAESQRRVAERWPESEPAELPERLAHLVETLAIADSRVAGMLDELSEQAAPRTAPSAEWLAGGTTPPFVADNCRLYLGRWAVQQQLYDEAFEHLDGLTTEDVADPAGLLFYQAVARHRLLQKGPALESLGRLLQGSKHLPRRYLAVAELMRADLEGLEDDSLDHIARRMDDIRRRLHLGRADKQVRQIEDGVIESLDKLIEKAENQQQQRQQQQACAPSGSRPAQPAQDSRLLPGRGPGEVTKTNIGQESGWGDLPPKQREAALQQIGREFPAHYRDAIEQYFRRLAGSENERK